VCLSRSRTLCVHAPAVEVEFNYLSQLLMFEHTQTVLELAHTHLIVSKQLPVTSVWRLFLLIVFDVSPKRIKSSNDFSFQRTELN
jgi:hypothetical protein